MSGVNHRGTEAQELEAKALRTACRVQDAIWLAKFMYEEEWPQKRAQVLAKLKEVAAIDGLDLMETGIRVAKKMAETDRASAFVVVAALFDRADPKGEEA